MIGMAVTAAAGLASGIMGGVKAGKQRREMQRQLNIQRADNQAFHDANYYADATQRADSQNMIAQLRDTLGKRAKRSASMGAVTGATQENQLAQREQDNNLVTNVYRNVNARAQQFKDNVLARYQQQRNALNMQQQNMYAQNAQGGDQLMQNGIGVLSNAVANLPVAKPEDQIPTKAL